MPLGLHVGCWNEWDYEYEGKNKSKRFWEWVIHTTEPDTYLAFNKYLLTEYSNLSTKKFYFPKYTQTKYKDQLIDEEYYQNSLF